MGPTAADGRMSFRHELSISISMQYRAGPLCLERGRIVNLSQTGMWLQAGEMLP